MFPVRESQFVDCKLRALPLALLHAPKPIALPVLALVVPFLIAVLHAHLLRALETVFSSVVVLSRRCDFSAEVLELAALVQLTHVLHPRLCFVGVDLLHA